MSRPSVDLHLHSSASDGHDSPARLVELAAEAGVETMALVDHDTLDGIEEAHAAAAQAGLELIPGTELSVDHENRKMHLLVYFVEPGRGILDQQLPELRVGRNERNREIVTRLNELGFAITIEDVERMAGGQSIGRPHIADALIELGAFKNRNEVFATLLHDGGPAYVERRRLSATRAIELARSDGGVPVIAHPYTMGFTSDELPTILRELTDVGLGGIEAWYPSHPVELRRHIAVLASQLGIAATGGSDYHGELARENRIAVGFGDLVVPHSALEQLQEQRA